MSLQTSSHPKARSLIVFLLSVISLGSILTQFSDIQDEVRDLPRLVRAVDEVSALDHIHNSSNDFQNLQNHDDNFFPDQMSTQKSPKNKGYRSQNKFIFKGCRKNKIQSGKKGLVSHEIFGLNQLEIEIL